MKILVIDDDKGFCLLVKRIIEKTGQFDVVTTTDPTKAEDLCRKEKPDLIILDNVMPEVKGSELVKRFRKNAKTKDILIIMLTGKGEMVYSEEKGNFEWNPNSPIVKQRGELEEQKQPRSICEAYGVDAYLLKPLNPRVLLGILEEILVKKREKDELEEWKEYNM